MPRKSEPKLKPPTADARALRRLARFMERHDIILVDNGRLVCDCSIGACGDENASWRLPRAYRARAKRKG